MRLRLIVREGRGQLTVGFGLLLKRCSHLFCGVNGVRACNEAEGRLFLIRDRNQRELAIVVPAEYFDARASLETVEMERCTIIYGVPTMFVAMLEEESLHRRNLKSLRSGIMAGSPCPIEVMRKVIDVMGCRVSRSLTDKPRPHRC
jgi:acyl-CoA synthetase (AMP-forming)/AMP-acid ligase II